MLKKGLTAVAGVVLVLAIASTIRMRPVRAKLNPPSAPPFVTIRAFDWWDWFG